MYDCIIIGMGCAGMSAGVYAKRAGLKTLILEENMPGGLLNKVPSIENYLGFKSISGSDLSFNMFEHVRNEKVEYKIARVLDIKYEKKQTTVYTTKGEFITKGLIVAIGRKIKKSAIANEEKFIGKGISYCAICDANLYKNSNVVVLGGSDSAFEEALYLNNIVKKVTIVVPKEIKASVNLINEVKSNNIEIINGVSVTNFVGKDNIEGLELNNKETIKCDGVFIYYGYTSDTAFLRGLDITDDRGYILVDQSMKTKKDRVYACGDIIKKDLYQVSTAVSEGAIAASSLNKEL